MRKPYLLLILALSTLLVLPSLPGQSESRARQVLNAGPTGSTDYPWTMFHYDHFREGVTPASGPLSAPTSPMWSYTTGNVVYSSPIVADGYVFTSSYDGIIYALDQDTGSLLWASSSSVCSNSQFFGSPAVANGMVYVACKNGYVYALNEQTGSVVWSLLDGLSCNGVPCPIVSSSVIADGMLFYGTFLSPNAGHADVFAVNAQNGAIIWRNSTISDYVEGSLSVSNGRVFLGIGALSNAVILALNETTGKQLWSYNTFQSATVSSAPVAAYGNLYVGLDVKQLVVLNQVTGSRVWFFNTPAGSNATTPAIYNNIVYFGTGGKIVYALNAITGAQIWATTMGGAVTSAPALSLGSRTLYVGCNDRYLYALNMTSGAVLWKYLSGGQISSSPSVANDQVFFGSKDHKVYALGLPSVPRLYDSVVSSPTTLKPGFSSTLTITVRNSTALQSSATLTLASSVGGTFSQPILIGAGTYQASFIAPMVTSATVAIIQVTASETGYLAATNQTNIPINAPGLYDSITSNSTSLKPGYNATLTITVRNSTTPQSADNLKLTSSGGGTLSQPVLIGAGTYQANFTAPLVTSATVTLIQVTASIRGYLSATNQTSITLNPFPTLTVAVSAIPTSITPGGEITLKIRVTNGTFLVSGASLQLSSTAGGSFSLVTDSGDGNYTTIFTTPLQASNPVVTVRASKAEFTSGQGQTSVQVNGIPNLTTLKLAGASFFLIVAVGTILFLLILGVIVQKKRSENRHFSSSGSSFSY